MSNIFAEYGLEASGITGFEGPEKKLEIDFKSTKLSNAEGLRAITTQQWQAMLDAAKCTILNHVENEHFTAYLLSESSLFVFPYKIMIKTCGTTTLLKVVDILLQYAEMCHLEVEWVFYARRNFIFPHKQVFPHCDWNTEVHYLNGMFDGNAYIMGPMNGVHWYVYIADYVDRPLQHCFTEQALEIMMTELDEDVMKTFYKRDDLPSPKDVTRMSGIADIFPDAEIDDWQFDPCGYSCNGMLDSTYFTIHITPEPHCSYVSFETNVSLPSYTELIEKVLSIFKPAKYTVVMFADNGSIAGCSNGTPFNTSIEGYSLRNKTITEFEDGDYLVTCCNYFRKDVSPPLPRSVKSRYAMLSD